MADTKKYVFRGVALSGTQRAARNGTYDPNHVMLPIRNAGGLTNDMHEVMQKRPFIECELLDPSLITSPAVIASSGGDFTSFAAYWQAYEDKGGLGATWKSATISSGLIVPLGLSVDAQGIATMRIRVYPVFAAGTAITWGTSSFTADVADIAYRITSVTVGGTGYTYIQSAGADYNYNVNHLAPNGLEPSEVYYDTAELSGRASILDLAAGTQARLEDSSAETVVLLLTDQKNGANTVSINYGTCRVRWNLGGDGNLELAWDQIAS